MPCQFPTPPYQENIDEASRSSLALLRVQRYDHCDYQLPLLVLHLLALRASVLSPLRPAFAPGSDGLGFIHSPQPRVSFVHLTQVRLGG
jgi:hypothetical protein